MTATFEINVDGMRTKDEGQMLEVVKFVSFSITGTDTDQQFTLHGTMNVGDPSPENFTPYSSLTPEQVATWIDADPSIIPVKAHIQSVLDKMVAEAALAAQPLPWAPPVPPTPTPAP